MARSAQLCAVVLAIVGACHDEAAPPPAALAPATPSAKPAAVLIDLSLGDGLEMRRPLRDGRLGVIPIVATAAVAPASYVTLQQAFASHHVIVRERPEEWVIDAVQIQNKGDVAIVAYAGELILDGKQDRMIAETRVIAPHHREYVTVFCIEMNREAGGVTFSVPGILAELDLRRVLATRAIASRPQDDVWAKIDAIDRELGLAPRTSTYRIAAARMAAGDAGARRARLASALASHPDRDRMVGLAAVIDGEVIAIDRFATPELFRGEEAELLGAYVANSGGAPHEGRTFLPGDVRALATSPGQIWTTDATFTAVRPL